MDSVWNVSYWPVQIRRTPKNIRWEKSTTIVFQLDSNAYSNNVWTSRQFLRKTSYFEWALEMKTQKAVFYKLKSCSKNNHYLYFLLEFYSLYQIIQLKSLCLIYKCFLFYFLHLWIFWKLIQWACRLAPRHFILFLRSFIDFQTITIKVVFFDSLKLHTERSVKLRRSLIICNWIGTL